VGPLQAKRMPVQVVATMHRQTPTASLSARRVNQANGGA